MLVDHFAILGIAPSATPEEIKMAYRQLARSYHPDLNPNDSSASDRFLAIQRAYETLTRPHLRQAYLEKRWYAQFRNQSLEKEALTLDRILQQCIELERFVADLDPHRMDRTGLRTHIQQLLESWSSIQWDASKEKSSIESIASLLLRSCRHLNYEDCLGIHQKMIGWLDRNGSAELLSEDWLLKKQRIEKLQRWWPVWMILLTIILAGIIWWAGR